MSVQGRRIKWQETLWLNLLRSACAGIVWCVILLLFGKENASDGFAFLLMPVLYFVILLPLGLIAPFFGPWGFLLNLMAAIAIVPGDPLVALLRLAFPQLVPVDVYYPVNWVLVLYVHE